MRLRDGLRWLSGDRVPMAWCNLLHLRLRLLVHVGGISFAVVLMFMEFGFWLALLKSQTAVIDHMNADLIIVSRGQYTVTVAEPFPRSRLEQAQAVPGVAEVSPLYSEDVVSFWNSGLHQEPNSDVPTIRVIRVLAFDPDRPAFDFPELVEHRDELKLLNQVLMDRHSKPEFGSQETGSIHELVKKKVRVAGQFSLGREFVHEATVITGHRTFAHIFSHTESGENRLELVEVGLVTLKPDADWRRVLSDLEAALPDDVAVYSRWGYGVKEMIFWQTATPMGVIFLGGALMGFAVGMMICYHVLYTNVSDNLSEYATLKAVGYSDGALTWVVFQEALILWGLAYLPGVLLSVALYALLAEVTALPLSPRWDISVLVGALTVGMCLCSGFLASRKLRAADPAEVF
jgi:putative ABC transport system permease protein